MIKAASVAAAATIANKVAGAISPEEPKAIADAITFLCSDEATFISGMPLDVQAGGNARNVT